MNSIISNIILVALILVAFLGIFSEPCDSLAVSQWMVSLILTKGIGAAAIYAIYRIVKHNQNS